mmetsp:Transcript_14489/g.47297  ORF Transcript_14489/g.47297 Transcript_14489/m.47297 type:complete len:374 (-) Transcript_14489:490-1611(-)|eukprot:scaffold13914_cov122-Isochrysis_galbana.AAC.3
MPAPGGPAPLSWITRRHARRQGPSRRLTAVLRHGWEGAEGERRFIRLTNGSLRLLEGAAQVGFDAHHRLKDVGVQDVAVPVGRALCGEVGQNDESTQPVLQEVFGQEVVDGAVDGHRAEKGAGGGRPDQVRRGLPGVVRLPQHAAGEDGEGAPRPPLRHVGADIQHDLALGRRERSLDRRDEGGRLSAKRGREELHVVLQDEQRRRIVRLARDGGPEEGVRHGAAALARGHREPRVGHGLVVKAGVEGGVPGGGDGPLGRVGARLRLEARRAKLRRRQLGAHVLPAVFTRAEVDYHSFEGPDAVLIEATRGVTDLVEGLNEDGQLQQLLGYRRHVKRVADRRRRRRGHVLGVGDMRPEDMPGRRLLFCTRHDH